MKITTIVLTLCAAFGVSAATFVTYEEFGAVGDGKTDDQAAIVAAHAAANEKGLPVKATDGRTYLIGKGAKTAVVKTDVDFGTAQFLIDDVGLKDVHKPVFSVEPSRKPETVAGVSTLEAGQSRLAAKLPGPSLVVAENKNARQYIRYGANQNNGTAQKEVFLVDASGAIDPRTPVTFDFAAVTALKAHPLEAKRLTVRGGRFTTIANQAESRYTYHARNIQVRRSNVLITGLRHDVTGELDHGAPYGGFINISTCANVTVSNCTLTAHRTYSTIGSAGRPVSMGSYDLLVNTAARVSFIDCRQTTDIHDGRYWGLFASNFCKDLLFDRCVFSRFDAHMGVANATILNSELGHMGINAIGFGTFRVENTKVCGRHFFNLRSDYGSTWHGDFVIKNCVYKPRGGARPEIVGGQANDRHDFGYACAMPRRLVIDGLVIDDEKHPGAYEGPYIFNNLNPADKPGAPEPPYPYQVTEEVVLHNVKVASGRPLRVSPNKHMFRKTKVTTK